MNQKTQASKQSPLLFLYRVIQGALIGGGAILPGVSGGVLAVVFGIYRPMMAFLAHPFRAFKENVRLFTPVIIGFLLGFWLVAKAFAVLFARYEFYLVWLFVGLILGTIPLLYKQAGEQRRNKVDFMSMLLSFVALLAVLLLVSGASGVSLPLNPFSAFVSGIIWGLSMVVPGLSSSSLLIFVGLYYPIMAAVSKLDLMIIAPLGVGIAIVALGMAKLVDHLFEKHHSIASHAVVGLVLASTLMIIPREGALYASTLRSIGGPLAALVGFVAAYLLGIWSEKIMARVDKA